jgi:hypothetical protein
MLINASRIVIESEARIEFNGIGVPNVVTCGELVWREGFNHADVTDFAEPGRKGQCLVSS